MNESNWPEWDRFEWNRELVQHYFATDLDNSEPIDQLEVSWSALQRVTGDPAASVDEVRDRFLDCLRRALADKPIVAFAAGNGGAAFGGIPGTFVFLYTTCLAAAEVQEDREVVGEIERDFSEALCTLLGSDRHASHFEELPRLWREFAEWTNRSADAGSHRRLVLPDPGHDVRIGYSKRLVFPRVRDQIPLARLLDAEGCLMEDPPVSHLVAALRQKRKQVRGEVGDAFDEFAALSESGGSPSMLAAHRFMTAVNTVARNAELLLDPDHSNGSWSITLSDYVSSVEFAIVTSSERPFRGAETERDDYLPGGWSYRIVSVEGSEEVLEFLLSRPERGPLSSLLRPGILLFSSDGSGHVELARRGRLEDVSHLLVRADRLDQLRRAFNISDDRVTEHGPDGWSLVRDPRLRQLEQSDLEANELNDVLVLLPRPIRRTLSVRNGVQVSGEYLGLVGLMPLIHAPNAVKVEATLKDEQLELSPGPDVGTTWRLPERDLVGRLAIRAEFEDGAIRKRSIEFVSEPSSTTYKQPSRLEDWMVETVAGTSKLTSLREAEEAMAESEIEIEDAVHRIYLGGVVGEFLPSSHGAEFELQAFGTMKSVRCIGAGEGYVPTARVSDDGSRRRWRKLMGEYASHAADESTRRVMRRVVAMKGLDRLDVHGSESSFRMVTPERPEVHPRCRVVQSAIGAICTSRAGMNFRAWTGLLESAFGIDRRKSRFVYRAWLEAGLVEELRRIRWQGLMVFARSPSVVLFRIADRTVGSIDGLVMPTRLARLMEIADEIGLEQSHNRSASSFVPTRLMVRGTPDSVRLFAERASLPVRCLGSEPLLGVEMRDVVHGSPPMGYTMKHRMSVNSGTPGRDLTMYRRPDAPPYWAAQVGERVVWSYSPEAAAFRLSAAAGESVADLGSGSEVRPVGAFLPLAVARWLAIVSGTNPGGTSFDDYVNPTPSRSMATRVCEIVRDVASGRTR